MPAQCRFAAAQASARPTIDNARARWPKPRLECRCASRVSAAAQLRRAPSMTCWNHHRTAPEPPYGTPQEAALAGKGLHSLWAAISLAQEMGEGVGPGEILFGSMPQRQQAALSGTLAGCRGELDCAHAL